MCLKFRAYLYIQLYKTDKTREEVYLMVVPYLQIIINAIHFMNKTDFVRNCSSVAAHQNDKKKSITKQ